MRKCVGIKIVNSRKIAIFQNNIEFEIEIFQDKGYEIEVSHSMAYDSDDMVFEYSAVITAFEQI